MKRWRRTASAFASGGESPSPPPPPPPPDPSIISATPLGSTVITVSLDGPLPSTTTDLAGWSLDVGNVIDLLGTIGDSFLTATLDTDTATQISYGGSGSAPVTPSGTDIT